MATIESYGTRLPGLEYSDLIGKLIVIEGADCVGRSTQISLLKIWLQMNGRAVVDTELALSSLVGEGLKAAKLGHTLGPITMNLFYTTDLIDSLEHIIVPALRAGFVVVADRYIYTLMARAMVRGMDKEWLEKVYSFALKPDATLYLQLDVKELIPRVLHSNGFNFWESGMDLRLGETYYESFCEYQQRLIRNLDAMVKNYNFIPIDASKTTEEVFEEIKLKVAPIFDTEESARLKKDSKEPASKSESKTESKAESKSEA